MIAELEIFEELERYGGEFKDSDSREVEWHGGVIEAGGFSVRCFFLFPFSSEMELCEICMRPRMAK